MQDNRTHPTLSVAQRRAVVTTTSLATLAAIPAACWASYRVLDLVFHGALGDPTLPLSWTLAIGTAAALYSAWRVRRALEGLGSRP